MLSSGGWVGEWVVGWSVLGTPNMTRSSCSDNGVTRNSSKTCVCIRDRYIQLLRERTSQTLIYICSCPTAQYGSAHLVDVVQGVSVVFAGGQSRVVALRPHGAPEREYVHPFPPEIRRTRTPVGSSG